MKDVFLYSAGSLGVMISLAHGYLGEVKVVRQAQTPTRQAKRILHAIMFLSAVYWFAASVLLLVTPSLVSDEGRPVLVWGVAVVFVTASLANLWATRGRHFGWIVLAIATGLTVAGA